VDHATPFSGWRAIGLGDMEMNITDITAIDGATIRDKVHFAAEFDSPDRKHHYKVVADKPLPHGFGYPTFGGVVTDHLLHGATGIGARLMPTEYIYAAFWAKGDVYVDGKLTNPGQIIHMMKMKKKIMKMPPEKQKTMMAKLMVAKALMMKTKEQVDQAMMTGNKFLGQPFILESPVGSTHMAQGKQNNGSNACSAVMNER